MTDPNLPPASPSSDSIEIGWLGRYLDGTASAEERAQIEQRIGSDADRRAALASLQAAWSAEARRLGAPYDADAALARVWGGLPAGRQSSLVARLAWRRWLVAAVVVVTIGAGVRWFGSHREQPQQVAKAPAFREYATPRGRRAVFRLLDGTEITLNADSRLRVPSGFGAATRDVYLEGEAFFSVVHDSARTFAVHTARGTVRDLGTRFNVNAYPDLSADRVAVEEGAVELNSPREAVSRSTRLGAGEVGTLTPAQARVLASAQVQDELAWTEGRLAFRQVPLGEAALRLGRWYDLELRVDGAELAQRPITGSYGAEPVKEILELITRAVGARYTWRGRTVTITANSLAR
jgi:transmembrane sensor